MSSGKVNHSYIIALFGVLLAFLIWKAFHFSARQDGNFVYIDQGFTRSTLQISPQSEQMVYLLAGEGLSGKGHYQALLPVIPMGQVAELNRRYGDFRKCESPGASEAKNSVRYLRVSVGNSELNRQLKDLLALSKQHTSDNLIVLQQHSFAVVEQKSMSRRNRALEELPSMDVFASKIDLAKLAPQAK